jgi:hypothetical protein
VSLNKQDYIRHAREYHAYAAKKPKNAVPSRTITNATTTGTYAGHSMASNRPGAGDAFKIKSKGL